MTHQEIVNILPVLYYENVTGGEKDDRAGVEDAVRVPRYPRIGYEKSAAERPRRGHREARACGGQDCPCPGSLRVKPDRADEGEQDGGRRRVEKGPRVAEMA